MDNDRLAKALGEHKCTSGRECTNQAQEPHTCPFASEIHNDNETLCECCTDCEHECAMDV